MKAASSTPTPSSSSTRPARCSYNALMKLPNMTQEIADAIVDWVDTNDDVRPNGAESSDYAGPGAAVPGQERAAQLARRDCCWSRASTPQLLFGTDRNRNGSATTAAARSIAAGPTTSPSTAARSTSIPRACCASGSTTTRTTCRRSTTRCSAVGLDEEMAAYLIAAKIYTRTQLDAQGNPLQMGKGGGGARARGRKQQKIRIGDAGRPHHRREGEPRGRRRARAEGRQLGLRPGQHPRDAPATTATAPGRSASASKRRWSSTARSTTRPG